MTRALQAVWDEFIYGGHLQALGSAAIVWTAAWLLAVPLGWGLPVATYAVAYAVYLYNRLLEISADAETNPARTDYIKAHRRTLWAAFFLSSVLAAVVLIATARPSGVLFLAVLYAFGLLYTIIFKTFTRYVPGFKSWYVAGSFAVLVFLPFVYSAVAIPTRAAAELAGWVFWNAAIMQIFLDVKDAESDARAGLRTIPLLLGFRSTYLALRALTILSVLPPVVWAIRDSFFPPEVAALAFAPLISLPAFRIAEKGAYQGYLIESGKFISWPALLTVGRAMSA